MLIRLHVFLFIASKLSISDRVDLGRHCCKEQQTMLKMLILEVLVHMQRYLCAFG